MKLVTYDRRGLRRLGAMLGEAVIDLPDLVGHPAFPTSSEGLVARNGGTILQAARSVLSRSELLDGSVIPGARLLPPVLPSSLRHFEAFGSAAERDGHPVSAVGNHRTILGPDEEVPWPSSADGLDYSVEVACVIGRRGRELSASGAGGLIFGYTLAIDWTVRDGQRGDGVGNTRALGVATSLGPILVTADEIDPRMLSLVARVDGEVWSAGWVRDARWTFPEMVSHVSRSEDVLPGAVYLSGSFPGGCSADLGRRLEPGMTVEVAAEGIGALRARVGHPA